MPQASETDATVRFGEFEVDLARWKVLRNGVPLVMQDKPLQLLLVLLEQPGQLMTREELCRRLWPDDNFGAFEDGLNTAVRKLRIALNDSSETPEFIETVPRRGYRFIAPVEPVPSPASELVPAIPVSGRRWWRTALAIAALALLAVAVWMVERWRSRNQSTPQPAITSLAVLPLKNQTGDGAQSFFVDGMTDELTTSLAQLNNLKVISETSAMHYRNTNKPLRQIAQELGVDGIVEGAVARSGDQVRVTAQLIDARNDRHLWAESYVRKGDDVLGLQQEVARTIADQVHVALTPAEAQRLQTLPTHNRQAYDAYLRASYLTNPAQFSESDDKQIIELANEAVTLDPNFAQAYVVLAQGYVEKIFFWSGSKEDDEKASVALDKALAINPNLAEAYNVRSNLYYNHLHGYDLVNSAIASERAVAINPNDSQAHHLLGGVFTHSGLHDRAVKEYRAALALDPMNDGAKYRLSRALWQAQQFQESLDNYDRYNIKSIEETLPLLYLGRRQQAWDLVAELTPQAGKPWRLVRDFPPVRALLYASEGKAQEAEREIQEGIRLGSKDDHFHHAAFIIAAAYAEMGKPHEAVQWLRRTEEIGMPNYPLFHDNPSMKKLYGNHEYEQYMADFKPRWDHFAASL